ncbi:hypothetical protein KP509_06G012300 [Ceratopteris richardii]|uniref:Uncharacterized protein n=1 Tax=Ceratopteris richardii TaxID=49495 RepID=A0A8T2ULE9_CERRI|nr:hypothetical protein KP509_06G012300 [Ceratopteris richardii]
MILQSIQKTLGSYLHPGRDLLSDVRSDVSILHRRGSISYVGLLDVNCPQSIRLLILSGLQLLSFTVLSAALTWIDLPQFLRISSYLVLLLDFAINDLLPF